MDNLGYLFAAFAVVWAVLFAYVLGLSRKQRQLRREIDSLKKAMAESEPTRDWPSTM